MTTLPLSLRSYDAGTRTTVVDLSIRTHRAGRFSCGATRRRGPALAGSTAPSTLSTQRSPWTRVD